MKMLLTVVMWVSFGGFVASAAWAGTVKARARTAEDNFDAIPAVLLGAAFGAAWLVIIFVRSFL